MKRIRSLLDEMANAISPVDHGAAVFLRACKSKTPQELANELYLWGGSGSLLDRSNSLDVVGTRGAFEKSAAELAQALIDAGAQNPRLEFCAKVMSRAGRHDA